MSIHQKIIDAIPRHPADSLVAYGHDLDAPVIKTLLDDRILTGAIFRGYCNPEELAQNVRTLTFSDSINPPAMTVLRLIAVQRAAGLDLGDPEDLRNKFSEHAWLTQKMESMSLWPRKKLGEFGFHILHAFQNSANGLTPYWHTHDDITAHLTASGAGLEWLPSSIDPADAKKNPEKYEHLVQRVDVGDLAVIGRLPHRSSSQIKKLGQLAVIAGGPLVSEFDY